jgi:hypothetical protein
MNKADMEGAFKEAYELLSSFGTKIVEDDVVEDNGEDNVEVQDVKQTAGKKTKVAKKVTPKATKGKATKTAKKGKTAKTVKRAVKKTT